MRKIRTTNPELINLIRSLKKWSREHEARLWRDIADRLTPSRRRRTTVNVSHLNRHTIEGETVVVPGKVLGSGQIDHPIEVAAFAFSADAELKIQAAKGKCLSIQKLAAENPKGTKVRIIG
jgi:large subunit ribosomal protein L18e